MRVLNATAAISPVEIQGIFPSPVAEYILELSFVFRRKGWAPIFSGVCQQILISVIRMPYVETMLVAEQRTRRPKTLGTRVSGHALGH